MHDDPFARAVEKVQDAEKAQQESKRRRRQEQFTEGNRTAFRVHATVYATVNLMLIAIWFTTWQFYDTTSYPWFLWVLFGWGIGLAAHYSAARNHLKRQAGQPRTEAARAGGDTAPAAPSTGEELSRLAGLHSSGALSDEEFSAAKAKLLE